MGTILKNSIFVIIVSFLIISLSKNIFDYKKKVTFYKNYQTELDKEKKNNQKLQSEIKKSEDYNSVEKTIREKLNVLKPDEIAVILPEKTPTPSPLPPTKKPIYAQWFELIVKN
jgi:cell division protein FtsB